MPSMGLVKVFEMLIGNLEGSANCHLDGLPGCHFCRRHLLNFHWMTRWRDKHETPCEAFWAAWLFHHCSHLPSKGKFHNYLPLNEAFVMKWSAFLGTISLSLQEQQIRDSEIMSERITLFDFSLTSDYFFSYCGI